MSDINLDFTVSNNSINFTVEPNDITFTPTDILLTINPSIIPGAGGNIGELQYNNGSLLAGIPTATYTSGNLALGNVANLKITGGVNGYVLQTDGTGNLDWTAMTGGGGGNGTPGGSNTQIQYNDGGSFGGNTGFTFNEVTGNVAIPGSLSVVGNIAGNVQNAYLANFATLANAVAGANVSGQVNYAAVANSVAGANVSGTVATAGTVTTNAQPNITSVGNLSSLSVTGNITAGNANLGNTVTANYFIGDGGNISNINVSTLANGTSNISIPVANSHIYISPNIANTAIFYSNGVSYIGSILSNGITLGIAGGISYNDGKIRIQAGTGGNGNRQITIGATSAGNSISSISIGNVAGSTGLNSISIGEGSRAANQETVSIGFGAGVGADARRAVFIGYQAGTSGNSNISGEIGAVGIGAFSATRSSDGAVAIGYQAANNSQDYQAIALGFSAGIKQANYAVALGSLAGYGNNGANTQGANSIAIGYTAGYNISHANTIILNGSGQQLDSTQANSLFVKPIRDVTGNASFTVTLKYNPTTGEIGYV